MLVSSSGLNEVYSIHLTVVLNVKTTVRIGSLRRFDGNWGRILFL
jgi:hypothetical protein